MADSKKYDDSQWEHSLRKLTTSTDTLTLPAVIYGDGTNATVDLKGNTVQNGTPTPQNPVMPNGTGERTENLVEKRIDGCNISSSGVLNSNASWNIFVAKIEQGKTYSVDTPTYAAFYELTPIIGSSAYDGQRYSVESSFTSPIDGYVAFRKIASELTAMCNEGSTPLPYEPYGQYKIPILNNSQTTNVYLGEVETTRKIKKLVFTGNEEWTAGGGNSRYIISVNNIQNYAICSHFAFGDSLDSNEFDVVPNRLQIRFNNAGYTTLEAWQTFLAQRYAAGTPVTVWYVLAAETTGIVNEPLMKIGDYADTLGNVSIPTVDGANTITVDTTVQPSEVELTYTGWHNATVKEWDGSDWQ